jgi:cytochrome d ubiquinol oxidase subunit I
VTGVLNTEQAVAAVPAPMVATTLIAYLAVYAALLIAYIGAILYLARKAANGDAPETTTPRGQPMAAHVPGE